MARQTVVAPRYQPHSVNASTSAALAGAPACVVDVQLLKERDGAVVDGHRRDKSERLSDETTRQVSDHTAAIVSGRGHHLLVEYLPVRSWRTTPLR